jgi:hypothetical protein
MRHLDIKRTRLRPCSRRGVADASASPGLRNGCTTARPNGQPNAAKQIRHPHRGHDVEMQATEPCVQTRCFRQTSWTAGSHRLTSEVLRASQFEPKPLVAAVQREANKLRWCAVPDTVQVAQTASCSSRSGGHARANSEFQRAPHPLPILLLSSINARWLTLMSSESRKAATHSRKVHTMPLSTMHETGDLSPSP